MPALHALATQGQRRNGEAVEGWPCRTVTAGLFHLYHFGREILPIRSTEMHGMQILHIKRERPT